MRTPVIWIISTVATVGLIAAGTAVALAATAAPTSAAAGPSPSASVTDDSDLRSAAPSASPSSAAAASDIEAAIATALAATGPGTVIDAEVDDNAAHAYEIDVRLDAGGVVEVTLDAALKVLSSEVDDRGSDDRGSDDD
jgi:uncharacterized membrane protein YkoI